MVKIYSTPSPEEADKITQELFMKDIFSKKREAEVKNRKTGEIKKVYEIYVLEGEKQTAMDYILGASNKKKHKKGRINKLRVAIAGIVATAIIAAIITLIVMI